MTPNFNVILSEANVANGVEDSLVGPQGNRNHSAGSAASLEIHQLQPPSLRLTWKGHGIALCSDARGSVLFEQRLNVQSRLGEGWVSTVDTYKQTLRRKPKIRVPEGKR